MRNLENGRTATVKVNDRGPFKDNRVMDLSYAAALKLGVVAKGTAFVEVRAISANGAVSSAPPREVAAAPALTAPPPTVIAAQPQRVKPPPSAPPKPAPAALPASSGMYLQVGAYAERRNAEKVSEQVAHIVTTGVEIREIKSNNKVFYRVQIGPLPSTEVADKVVAALEKLGITQHYFITN